MGWTDKLLEELKENVDADKEEETTTKRKGARGNGAKRSKPYFR